ncbi:MAG: hypothetical protein FJ272_09010, partial [Planctomycetes bacterium]|nr:hypothetical protein [Planctomycetota bacterium]
MRRKTILACGVAGLALMATSVAFAAATASVKDGQAVIGNDSLERRLSLEGGVLRTTTLVNRLAKAELAVKSDEFALRLNDAQELTAADFRVVSHKVEDAPRGAKRLSVLLENRAMGLEARVDFEVAADDFFMRKRLAIRAVGRESLPGQAPVSEGIRFLQGMPTVNWVEVERFATESAAELGGMGQPVFLGQCFFLGLEYPAAYNTVSKPRSPQLVGANSRTSSGLQVSDVALRHNPGRRLTGEFWESKPAVLGVSAAGQVETAFARYVSLIRVPPRTHNLYNSWYDVRQRDMSNDAFLAVFDGFKKNLYDKHGLKLDSFVIDDGWQDRDSIWGINAKLFPDGFGGLVDGLRAAKTDLGLWLPLTAVKGNLNMEWGKANGYEVADTGSHYCLSGPNYNKKLREVLADYIRRYKVAYLKHDFNSFSCAADGHGHLPRREYGFEANVDAYIEMLKFTRSLNPNIFLNVTGGMWLSPWWLMYADTV